MSFNSSPPGAMPNGGTNPVDGTFERMLSPASGLVSVDVIPVEYEAMVRDAEEQQEQFAKAIASSHVDPSPSSSPYRHRRIDQILAASPSGLWFKITSVTRDPTTVGEGGERRDSAGESATLNDTVTSELAAHVDQNVFDEDVQEEKRTDATNELDSDDNCNAGTFNGEATQTTLSAPLAQTFVVFRSLDHLVWFQRQLLEKEPFLVLPELPISVETAAEDPLRATDQIVALIATVAATEATSGDPLFWSLITQPDDDFFEMYRGLVYGGNGAAGSDAGGGVAGVGGSSSSPSTTFASSLLGAFRRVKAKATGTSYGLTDENGVPVLEGERAKFALCETVHDAVAQEMKLTKMSGSDRQGHTSAVAPICSSLDVADTWWECEGNLTEANLIASTRSAAAAVGVNSDSDGSGRQGLVSSPMGGYTLQQSQKERLLESQLVRRQRRDEELEALQKRFTEKLLTQINAHLRLPNTETKPRNLSTMMLASCAIDRAFFSCDKLKEVIASSYFFQNELLRNDGLYYAWGESLVAIYKLRVALDGLQEASRDASEAWKEFCCTHYWPYTREKVTEEELKPKLSPRVHTSNRLTHYTLRSASVLAQVSQTEKGIITEGFVSAVTTGAMLAAAHRWRCAVLHQQLHRGNSVLPSARLASGGWGVVAAGGSPALPRAQPTSNKLSDQHNSIPCGPGSILASSLKALSVGKAATGLPASFVSGCAKLITPASGKTGRNIFQLQKDLKRVCEEGNGVPELETLDMIDEDSSIIQDFLDVSTSSFEDHHAQIQKQLLHPQLLSTIHEMVLYQKLSWQATEMVAKEFQRIIDQDLFLEALTEELPFLDISKSSIPPPHSVRYTQTPNGDVVASTSSTALATTTQFGSVASMFRRRRAAQHVEEEAGEAAWRARQERMEAEKLHNTHGGHYMGESTTYYTSSPGGGHHADDHGASSKGGKPRSSSLFTWKKTGPPSSAPSSQSRRHGGGGGGEEMTEMTSSHSGKADTTNNNYGGTAYGGGQKNPSTLEANNYRHSAIRAKVSELGSSAYSYHGGYGASINDDFDANPFDVPTGRPPPLPTQPKRVVRSLSPKFSPNDDDEDSTGSPWNKGRSVFGKDTKSRTSQVPPPPSNRVSIVPDEEVFASSFSGDMSRKKKGWGERATAQKRPSMSHDDPFGGA